MGRKRRRRAARGDFNEEAAVMPSSTCFDGHPHLQQARGGTFSLTATLRREMTEDCGRLPYRRRTDEPKSTLHWGQRKLLVAEIEFLTTYHSQADVCVYIGAAPGTHIPFLAQLFPFLRFILVDPSSFAISESYNVIIHQIFATPEFCSTFRSMKTILISDIRTADHRIMTPSEVDACIQRDMELQKQCVIAQVPVACMLKFRLPWSAGSSTYLKGKVFFPIWGPQTTTESRLVCTSLDECAWSHSLYNERMFYFNVISRPSAYFHHVCAKGIDFCYDCAAEVQILAHFVLHNKHLVAELLYLDRTASVDDIVALLIEQISHVCSPDGSKTLAGSDRVKSYQIKLYDSLSCSITDYNEISTNVRNCQTAEEICMSAWQNCDVDVHRKRWSNIFPGDLCNQSKSENETINGLGPYNIGYSLSLACATSLWFLAVLEELCGDQEPTLILNSDSSIPCERALAALRHCSSSISHIYNCLNIFSKALISCHCDKCLDRHSDSDKNLMFILFCSTGIALMLTMDSSEQFVLSKTLLPTVTSQHLSLLRGRIIIEGGRRFVADRLLCSNGITTPASHHVDHHAALNHFIEKELNFTDLNRLAIFEHSGFEFISSISKCD